MLSSDIVSVPVQKHIDYTHWREVAGKYIT